MENFKSLKSLIDETLIEYKNHKDLFFDWWCGDRALEGRADRLWVKVLELIWSPRIKQSEVGLIFKNNCPLDGSLYDDFRFTDKEGNVIFTIIPKSGHRRDKGRAFVWGRENDFKEPLFEGSWKGLVKWFNNR